MRGHQQQRDVYRVPPAVRPQRVAHRPQLVKAVRHRQLQLLRLALRLPQAPTLLLLLLELLLGRQLLQRGQLGVERQHDGQGGEVECDQDQQGPHPGVGPQVGPAARQGAAPELLALLLLLLLLLRLLLGGAGGRGTAGCAGEEGGGGRSQSSSSSSSSSRERHSSRQGSCILIQVCGSDMKPEARSQPQRRRTGGRRRQLTSPPSMSTASAMVAAAPPAGPGRRITELTPTSRDGMHSC